MKLNTFWAGGELREQDKADLLRLKDTFPDWDRTLWVHPRDTGPDGADKAALLMDSYRQAAEPLGFAVKDLRAEADDLVSALPEGKRNGQLVKDIWQWEMQNDGQISVKDMAAYLVEGKHGGLSLDLSARPTAEAGQISGTEAAFDRDFAVPMINEREIINYMPEEHRTYSEEADFDNDDAMVTAPQIDIWAMWAKEGTEGQTIMQGAAESMIDKYVKMAETGVKDDMIEMQHGPGEGRFVPGRVDQESALGKKANREDPSWAMIPGELAGHSLYDGLAKVDGETVDQYGTDVRKVREEKWPERTWPTGMAGERDRTLPGLNITKSHEASWKQGLEPTNPLAQVARMRLDGSPPAPSTSQPTTPPRVPSPALSNTSSTGQGR